MLIVQYWSRNVTAKWDNLHKSKEQVASLLRRSYAISPPVPTNRRIRKYKTEHLPKLRDAKFQKFHLHPLHFNTFKVPAVTSLVVSHTYRRINRPPSHKSSTRKAWTVYLSGIPTQATSWPKHMITKTPQETATVCLNTCHDLTYCSYIFVPLCWSRTNFTIPPA